MSQLHLIELCRSAVQTGLVLLLQTSLILLLGLGLGWAMRRRGPLAQSLVYRTTLLAVSVMVAVSVTVGSASHAVWHVSLPSAPVQTTNDVAKTVLPRLDDRHPAARVSSPALPVAIPSPAEQAPAVSAPPAMTATRPPSLTWQSRLYLAAALLWGVGILWRLMGIALNLWALRRLRRNSELVASGPAFALVTALPNMRRGLSVRTSLDIRSPFLAGIRRPIIYLPTSYATDFNAAELQAIVAHEAAHQERQDVAWTLAARLACTLLWPQPLLWLLIRRMDLAAEEACDILALTEGCPSRTYADCLLSLAERLTPSRAERRLGLGVVPFRSQVGRRIQQILSETPRPRQVSRGLRLGIALSAIVAVMVGLFVIAGSRQAALNKKTDTAEKPASWAAPSGYLAQFTQAERWGGHVQPIQILSVFDKTVRYPSPLTEDENSLIRQCKSNGFYNTYYGSGGPPVHDRQVLEKILAQRPHFFYAEYLISNWYKKSDNPRQAQVWMERALQDAPAIIAGRVQFADGRPVNGYTFTPQISLYPSADSQNGPYGYDDPHTLNYPDVTADARGCYYLPVFRAVYAMPGRSWSLEDQQSAVARLAYHMDVMSPQTGHGGLSRFAVTGHIGVLPPMIARPYLTVGAPFGAVNQKQDHPLRVSDAVLTVTWPRSAGAAKYEAHLTEVILGPHGNRSENDLNFYAADPHFHSALPTTSLILPLSGSQPALFRNRLYSLVITARDADGNQLSDSQPYYFRPLSGVAPVPLTKAGLTKLLPPGFIVTAITKTAQGGVITGTMPEASNLDILLDRNPFAWKSQKSREWPLYAGGVYTGRNHFRIVYSNTGQVTSADVPSSTAPIGRVIVGHIRFADGKPAPGVPVVAHMEMQSMSAYLARGKTSSADINKEHVHGISQADGSFRLAGVMKGHYDIIEMEKSGKWVAAARTGIVIRGGETVTAPDLVLTRGAIMTGVVYDKKTGQPIPGSNTGPFINVLGPRYPASMGGSSSGFVDGRGHYAVRLAPGDNWVTLSGGWESSNIGIDPMNNSNPKYPNYARGFHVLLREGETKTVPINAVR